MSREPERADPPEVLALAELDAGLPDAAEAARRRAAAQEDARSAAVLAALAATRAELAALSAPPVPPEVAARWAAALHAEGADVAPSRPAGDGGEAAAGEAARGGDRRTGAGAAHLGPPPAADPPRRRFRIRRPLLAAAALVVAVAGGAAVLARPAEPRVPTLAGPDLVAVGTAAVGERDLGALADPARRAGCLRAVAPSAAELPLLGGRRVVLDDRPAVLLVLATGTLGRLRLVAVDAGCGGDGGTLLADTVVG